jgi:hypothetical protein
MLKSLPKIGDRLYYMQREIIVIKTLYNFHLIKIRYIGEIVDFYVDKCTLNESPDYTNSISLRLLGGRNK